MPLSRWRERAALRVLREGGHAAEIPHKKTGVNPLRVPPWPTMDPSRYDAESKLLSGIHGHNLCLDLFGGPTADDAAAGMTTHGEGRLIRWPPAAPSCFQARWPAI